MRPAGLGTLLKVPAITLLALGFTTYNLQFFALMTFLPVFLMQRLGVALETAGLIGAAIVAANALGNVAAGFILSRGIRPGALLASTAILMGLTGAAFFHAATPDSWRLRWGSSSRRSPACSPPPCWRPRRWPRPRLR